MSGGRDSVSLLYLLRFRARSLPLDLTVAHLDHAMRPQSAADALWVRGLCRAWGVPLVSERLAKPPRGETEAREARYAFLRRAADGTGARFIVTGHHADDQAETVLFRALRGTGLAGLAGMAALSPAGVLRPLLPFWREEIEEFARERGLRWREDHTNRETGAARNRIRLELFPLIEREVAPGARRSLVALARLAREAEDALQRETRRAMAELHREEGGWAILARVRLRDYDSPIGTRIVRNVLRHFGVVLGRTGTRRALQFIIQAPSGRVMELPAGVRVELEFDLARIGRPSPPSPDEPLAIETLGPGDRIEKPLRIGGRLHRARVAVGPWTGPSATPDAWRTALPLSSLRFPLLLRGWEPGDRVRTSGGTKTLKKLFVERRIPRSLRHEIPVLVDAGGSVLWIGGIERAPGTPPRSGEEALFLTIVND